MYFSPPGIGIVHGIYGLRDAMSVRRRTLSGRLLFDVAAAAISSMRIRFFFVRELATRDDNDNEHLNDKGYALVATRAAGLIVMK